MLDALELSGDDAGWAHLGTFGSYLTKLKPDFDSRLYGKGLRTFLSAGKLPTAIQVQGLQGTADSHLSHFIKSPTGFAGVLPF